MIIDVDLMPKILFAAAIITGVLLYMHFRDN